MGFENKLFRKAPAPAATKAEPAAEPAAPQAPANNVAFTPEEELWFKAGDVKNQAAENELARREQVTTFNAREAKIKAAEAARKEKAA